jgi:hypothetical protein
MAAAELPLEAEKLEVKSGWEIIGGRFDGYFPSTPNFWSADRIRAKVDVPVAEAQKKIEIPDSGKYNLWARYESPYGFDVGFKIKVSQEDKTVTEARFGGKDDLKYFPFGRKWVKQEAWEWHNTDYVYQKLEVDLKQGSAEIVLTLDRNLELSADRIVDLFFLTSDLSLEPGDEWSGWYSGKVPPILGKFSKPVYFKVIVPADAKEAVVLSMLGKLFSVGYYMGPQEKLLISRDGVVVGGSAAADKRLQPGSETSWMRKDFLSCLPRTLTVSCQQPVELLVSIHPDGKDAERFKVGPDSYDIIVSTGNRRYEEFMDDKAAVSLPEYISQTSERLEKYSVPGKRAESLSLIATFDCGKAAAGVDFRRLAAAIGLNGQHYRNSKEVYGPEGKSLGFKQDVIFPSFQNDNLTMPCFEGDFTAYRQRIEWWRTQIQAEGAGNIPIDVKMLEETGPGSFDNFRASAKINEQFRSYLKEKGVSNTDVLADAWDKVMIGTGMPEESLKNPILFYNSYYFRSLLFARNYASATRIVEELFPKGTRTNSGSLMLSSGNTYGVMNGDDPFMLFREHGLTSYSSETTWGLGGTPDYLGPQSESFGAAFGRSLAKYNDAPLGNYLIADGQRGYNGDYVELVSYVFAAQGFSWWSYYEMCYLQECTFLYYRDILEAVKRVSYKVGAVEDKLVGSKVVPPKVAIGWSFTTNVWDKTTPQPDDKICSNSVYPQERQNMYLMLRHLQVPTDLLDEQDLSEGRLKDYTVFFLVGDHLTEVAAAALAQWVQEGGTLVSVAGGGLRDQYDRPLNTLLEVFGISGAKLEKKASSLRPKLEMLHLEPLDNISFGGGKSLPVFGYRQSFTQTTGTVTGRFGDGTTAAVSNVFGKGRAVIIGALPGCAYLWKAFPKKPFGRGGADLSMDLFPDYNLSVRESFATLIKLPDGLSPVKCSEPLLEANVLRNPKTGRQLISLVNFSGKPLTNVRIELDRKILPGNVLASFGKIANTTEKDGVTAVELFVDKFELLELQ